MLRTSRRQNDTILVRVQRNGLFLSHAHINSRYTLSQIFLSRSIEVALGPRSRISFLRKQIMRTGGRVRENTDEHVHTYKSKRNPHNASMLTGYVRKIFIHFLLEKQNVCISRRMKNRRKIKQRRAAMGEGSL